MSTTLPLYWKLSSADKGERIDASVKLVSSVLEFQAQFADPAAPGENTSSEDSEVDEEQAKLNGLDELNAEDVRYAVRRLIRGLASPRESSRLGFAVALTEVRVGCFIEETCVLSRYLLSFCRVLTPFLPGKLSLW